MHYSVRLDVSLEQTAVCILDEDGRAIMERSVASHPDDIGKCLADLAGTIRRVGLEAGPLAPWLYSGLVEHGFSVFWHRGAPDESLCQGFTDKDGSP